MWKQYYNYVKKTSYLLEIYMGYLWVKRYDLWDLFQNIWEGEVNEVIDETKLAMSWSMLKLGGGYMVIYYLILPRFVYVWIFL